MIQEWYELKKITGIGGLPTTVQGITKKAKLENWQRRRKTGVKGNVFEYNVRSMPESVQQALGVDMIRPTMASVEPSPTTTNSRLEEALRRAAGELEAILREEKEAQAKETFNNIERHLVSCYRKASEDGKVAILNMAESMANLQEKKEEVQLASDNLNVA